MEQQIALEQKSGITRRCSNCDADVLEEDKYCGICGTEYENTAPATATATEETIPFVFTGKAGEYFKIWIVNIALTILTLGVYSAWAKVRKNRYFYGNTLLQDAPFEYLADPVKILIGRFIALGIFALYTATIYFKPGALLLFWLLFLCIYPALVVKSLAFKARNTAYRNIRFDFTAKYGEAAGVLIGTGFLVGLTLGLAYPYYAFRRSQFIVDYSRYGKRYFDFSGLAKNFFAVYFIAMVIGVAGMILLGIFSSLFPFAEIFNLPVNEPEAAFAPLLLIYLWMGLFVYLPVLTYMKTAIPNLVLSNTSVGKNRLESTLRFSRMLWLYFSNAVAILFSLGLLIPWASIRLARYRFDNLQLFAVNRLDRFVAGEQEKVGAAGEEISDFFDFEVGI